MSQKRSGGRGGGQGRSRGSGQPRGQGGAKGQSRGQGEPARQAQSRGPGQSSGRGQSSGPGRSRGRGRPQRGDAGGPGRQGRDSGLGGTQIEGRQAVRELLLAGRRRCREIFLSGDVERSDVIADIVELARELRVPVNEISRSKLDSMSRTDAPQGVIAMAAPITETSLDQLLGMDGAPFLLAVDGVTDPGNLGALLRIADCAGVTGIILPRHRAVHVTPTVAKAAAGAVEYLPMALAGGLPSAIEELRSAGVWTVGLDMGGAESIHDLRVATDAVCLILGSEGRGLSRLVRERCDFVASIPIHGHLESLNVSAAGAVAAYEVARRRASLDT